MKLLNFNFDPSAYNEIAITIGMAFKVSIDIYDNQHILILVKTKKAAEKIIEKGFIGGI